MQKYGKGAGGGEGGGGRGKVIFHQMRLFCKLKMRVVVNFFYFSFEEDLQMLDVIETKYRDHGNFGAKILSFAKLRCSTIIFGPPIAIKF